MSPESDGFGHSNEGLPTGNEPVLLVLPPLYQTGREPDYNPKEPMSLMALAAHLRQKHVRCGVLDADVEALPIETTVREILSRNPRVLGLSVFQRSLPSVEVLVHALREKGLTAHITLGGITATLSHEAILRRLGNTVNSVVLGEGEITLLELSQKILAGQDWRETPGIAFSHNNDIVITSAPRKIVPSLYSSPSRDYLDYCYQKSGCATVLASRGCYGRCAFCSNYTFESYSGDGPRWRGRTPEEVVEEISQIASGGIKVFKFNDPNLFGPGKKGSDHVARISQGIIDRGLDLSLMAFCRGNDILANPDLLPLMRQAGFQRLLIGVEAANNKVLGLLQKDETIEEMERAINLVRAHDMSVVIGFMIFNPYTTRETLGQDLAFLKRTGFTPTLSKSLRVFDGTPIQGQMDEQGRLIACNPFDGYHEYTVPADIATLYMAMKHLSVGWLDTLKKNHQDKIWALKIAPSFHERTGFYSFSDLVFNLEVNWLQTLMDWTENGFTQEGIRTTLSLLWEKKFMPVLATVGVENPEHFTPVDELAKQVYATIKDKPRNTFPEEYRWQND